MNIYKWQGINAQGLRISGVTEAETVSIILNDLHQQAITPLTVRKKTFFWKNNQKISAQNLLDFTRQLTMLINSGISLAPALKIIQQSETHTEMKKLLNPIKNAVEAGQPLSEILAKYPNYFDSLYCNLIFVGEQSGTLHIILQELTQHQEKLAQLTNKIKKAMLYPVVVIAVALLVTAILLIFVVPQFQKIFQEFGADLPLYTQFVLGLSAKIKYFPLVLLAGALVTGVTWRWSKKRNLLDGFLLRIPSLGEILRENILARFARTFAITCAAGIPIPDALKMVANSNGNSIYASAILKMQQQVTSGQSIHMAMYTTQLFPERMTQMIAIAEESGNLAMVLNKLADFYERRVEQATESFTKLLEPVIMVVLGIIIGGLIAAMYLPIFRLGAVI